MSEAFPRRQRRLACYDPADLEYALREAHRAGVRRAIDWLVAEYGDKARELTKPLLHIYGGWRP